MLLVHYMRATLLVLHIFLRAVYKQLKRAGLHMIGFWVCTNLRSGMRWFSEWLFVRVTLKKIS